jgi:hypothetical protein
MGTILLTILLVMLMRALHASESQLRARLQWCYDAGHCVVAFFDRMFFLHLMHVPDPGPMCGTDSAGA